MNIFKSITLCL